MTHCLVLRSGCHMMT